MDLTGYTEYWLSDQNKDGITDKDPGLQKRIDDLKNALDYMENNGVINQSFIKGTFLGDDLNFCNEIRSAIETTISESKKIE